jgi:hypothetical protein
MWQSRDLLPTFERCFQNLFSGWNQISGKVSSAALCEGYLEYATWYYSDGFDADQ